MVRGGAIWARAPACQATTAKAAMTKTARRAMRMRASLRRCLVVDPMISRAARLRNRGPRRGRLDAVDLGRVDLGRIDLGQVELGQVLTKVANHHVMGKTIP